ncbi:MAG TPA: hypothetical protein VGM35_02265 [Xanthobacteraceae bacterium]
MMRACGLVLAVLLGAGGVSRAADAQMLTRGGAIVDPLTLRELDLRGQRADGRVAEGFGLRRMLAPESTSGAPLANDELFSLPSMIPVRAAIDREFERYVAQHRAQQPQMTSGVGAGHDLQLFDRDLLYSSRTRFVLAGIVNRMDRAFVSPATCGEMRLIYRLTRIDATDANAPRLPMTLNVVVKARRDDAGDGLSKIACSEIARRWLEVTGSNSGGVSLAAALTSAHGPLALVEPANVELLEFNLQIGHIAKSAAHDFRTDYLLKVFRRDPSSGDFAETPLENQIDRDRMLADPQLGRDFKRWLLEPAQMRALDRGTILIPDRFLAKAAIVPTPVGFVRSPFQPEFGLVQSGDDANKGLFADRDVVTALQQAAAQGVAFENVRSVAGFERRLNDITCAGCHQTRGIGGFHFPGVNWMAAAPSNETTVPASPHFIGDQARRRDILVAIRNGREPDYSRGFSSRPQLRGDRALLGTEYVDGWGAHCYAVRPGEANDPSFRSWTCAKGLACQAIGAGGTERMGMCFVSKR